MSWSNSPRDHRYTAKWKEGRAHTTNSKGQKSDRNCSAAALGDNRRRSTWEERNKKKKKKRVQLHRSLDHSPMFGQCFVTAKKNHSPNARAFSMLIFFFFFAFHHHRAEFKPHGRSKPNTQWKRAERNRASTDFCNLAIGGILRAEDLWSKTKNSQNEAAWWT